ncbi:MAG: HK97-gp10 family putative phage morphogenesis protein [Tabrizicola sp.]
MGTGLKSFQDRLRGLPHLVRDALGRGAVEAAEEVADTIRALVPVDEGKLRASVEVTGPGQSTPAHSYPGGAFLVPDNAAAVTVGNSDVRYPHLVEFGTVKTAAQPFFFPGYRLAKSGAAAKIKAGIRRAVRGGA